MWDIIVLIIVVGLLISGLGIGIFFLVREIMRELQVRAYDMSRLTADLVHEVGRSVREVTVASVNEVVRSIMGSYAGEVGKPVPQPDRTETSFTPDWFGWEENKDIDDESFGVGDIVYVEREHTGAAMIEDGDEIVPGVRFTPVGEPDLAGERFDG